MTSLIPISHNPTLVNTRAELNLIGANARGLKPAGRDLLPLKPDMLRLGPFETALIMDAVELLFAALLQFIEAQLAEKHAWDAVGIVKARLDRGQADGTVKALLHGSARELFKVACRRAPVAMYAVLETAPELKLRTQLMDAKHRMLQDARSPRRRRKKPTVS